MYRKSRALDSADCLAKEQRNKTTFRRETCRKTILYRSRKKEKKAWAGVKSGKLRFICLFAHNSYVWIERENWGPVRPHIDGVGSITATRVCLFHAHREAVLVNRRSGACCGNSNVLTSRSWHYHCCMSHHPTPLFPTKVHQTRNIVIFCSHGDRLAENKCNAHRVNRWSGAGEQAVWRLLCYLRCTYITFMTLSLLHVPPPHPPFPHKSPSNP